MTNASALAKLVHDAALLHHAKGEDAEVIECWRDIDAQARSIGPGQTSLIAGLVSLILDGIGLDALEQITPELRIDAADGASPEAIREVLVLLSNDGEARDAVARGFLAGRTAWADTYLKGTLGNPPSLVQPFVMLQWKRYGDLMARCAAEVREMRVSQSPPLDESDRLIGIIPQFTNVASETNQNVLKRRVLPVALAIRLYHHDHAVYPERLEQLVPEYIRAVPVDLHRVDGGPLGYLLEANGTRPVIYSVAGQRRAEEIRRGLPRTRAKLGSNSMADIQYFDVSAWLGTDSVSQGVHNQVEQSNAPRDSNQPDNDGKQK